MEARMGIENKDKRESFMSDLDSAIAEIEKAEELLRYVVAGGVTDAAITNQETSFLLGCSKSLLATIGNLRQFASSIPAKVEFPELLPDNSERVEAVSAPQGRSYTFMFDHKENLYFSPNKATTYKIRKIELLRIFDALARVKDLEADCWFPKEDIPGISDISTNKVKGVRRAMKEAGIISRVGAHKGYRYIFMNKDPETWIGCMKERFGRLKPYRSFFASPDGKGLCYRLGKHMDVVWDYELRTVFEVLTEEKDLEEDCWFPGEDYSAEAGVDKRKIKLIRRAMDESGIIDRCGNGKDTRYSFLFLNKDPEAWLQHILDFYAEPDDANVSSANEE